MADKKADLEEDQTSETEVKTAQETEDAIDAAMTAEFSAEDLAEGTDIDTPELNSTEYTQNNTSETSSTAHEETNPQEEVSNNSETISEAPLIENLVEAATIATAAIIPAHDLNHKSNETDVSASSEDYSTIENTEIEQAEQDHVSEPSFDQEYFQEEHQEHENQQLTADENTTYDQDQTEVMQEYSEENVGFDDGYKEDHILEAPVAPVFDITSQDTGGGGIWLLASFFSVLWVAAVCAFATGFFKLPIDSISGLIEGIKAQNSRDLILLIATLIAPLPLIWMAAIVARRAKQMRLQSEQLLRVAAQMVSEYHAPREVIPSGVEAEYYGQLSQINNNTPVRIRQEVERTTHALGALHEQLASIEEALGKQAGAIDDAAERAELKAKSIQDTLSLEREALSELTKGLEEESSKLLSSTSEIAERREAAIDPQGTVAKRTTELLSSLREHSEAVEATVGSATSRLERASERVHEMLTSLNEQSVALSSAPNLDDAKEGLNKLINDAQAKLTETTTAAVKSISNLAHASKNKLEDPTASAREGQLDELRKQLDRLKEASPKNQPVSSTSTNKQETAHSSDDIDKSIEDFTIPGAPKLDWEKLVKAANFPESEEDQETMDALYAVLADPDAAALLQSAEDTLSGLAEVGLYMEDLTIELAAVEEWRAYVAGNKDAAINGIVAESAIERAKFALENQVDLSESANQLTKQYNHLLSRLIEEGADHRLTVDLADSRTGRAFMLLLEALKKAPK